MTFEVEFTYDPGSCHHIDFDMVDGNSYYQDVDLWLEEETIGGRCEGDSEWKEYYVRWDMGLYTEDENHQITNEISNKEQYLINQLLKHYEQTKIDV